MRYIKTLFSLLTATLLVSAAYAAPSTNAPLTTDLGNWTFAVSGAGSTTVSGDSQTAFGGNFEVGHLGKLVLPVELGLRQGFGYSSDNGGNTLFTTKAFSDWTLFRVGNLELGAGGNVGATYGNTPFTWTVAPELVVRLYLKKDVDLFGRIEYPYDLNAGRANETLNYFLGVRVRF